MSLKREALRYLGLGLPVIPIDPESKQPIVKWTRYQTRLPTSGEVESWWDQHPDANIAVITGQISGLVVVDVDAKKADVAAEVKRAGAGAVIADTGGGGVHLFYAYPPGARRVHNRAGVRPGVDVRGDGGYVVVAPSVHQSGRKYKWRGGAPNKAKLSSLPSPPAWAVTREVSVNDNGEPVPRWLEDAMAGVSSGERNSTATRLAGYFINKQIPQDVVRGLLGTWNERNSPPLSGKDLDVIVASVAGTHARNTASTRYNRMTPNESDDPFAVVPFVRYMSEFRQDGITWTVPEWLPDKTICMVVAPPGTYKTWTLLDTAISIAAGVPFLGSYPVQNPGPVIIVQQEDFHGQMAERLSTIWHARMGSVVRHSEHGMDLTMTNPSHVPLYLHPDRRLRFDDSVVMNSMEEQIYKVRPRVVIIDPLYSTGDTDDYMAKTVQQMFRLKAMRDTYGCSFIIAHHTAKANPDSGRSQREQAWGSQFLNAFLETGWQMRQSDKPRHVLVRRHFKVARDAEEGLFKFDVNTESSPTVYKVEQVTQEHTTHEQAADSVVLAMEGDEPKTVNEIALSLGKHRSSVLRQLQKMGDRVAKTKDGKFYLKKP